MTRRWLRAVLGTLLAAATVAAAGAALWLAYPRPGLDAYARHRYDAAPAEDALTAAWFGTSALLLSDGTHAIFIDPFFTRPPGVLRALRNALIAPDEARIRAGLARAGVQRLDAVLVSHSHYDHAMDAPLVARLTGARLLGSASTANIGRGGDLPEDRIQVMTSGLDVSVGSFRITFIESRHAGATGGQPTGTITQPLRPPARYLDYRQGKTFSILIEHPQGRLLHHGSAGYLPGMLKLRRADVVFLGIALAPDLEQYLAEVVDAVGARRVIPVHWDDFTRSLDRPSVPFPFLVDLEGFFAFMRDRRPDLTVQTLELARPVSLFAGPAPPR